MEIFSNTEIITAIAIQLSLPQIVKLKLLNGVHYKTLSEEHFWKLKFQHDYLGTPSNKNWEKAYREYKPPYARTPYLMFSMSYIKRIRDTNSTLTMKELMIITAKEWRSLDTQSKQQYILLAKESKKNYIREMHICEQNNVHKYNKKKRLLSLPVFTDSDDTTSEDTTDYTTSDE